MPSKPTTLPELIAELESLARIESGRARVAMERAARVLREMYSLRELVAVTASITRALGETDAD